MILRRLLITLFFLACAYRALLAQTEVVPAMQHWEGQKGRFILTDKSAIVVDALTQEQLNEELKVFQKEMYNIARLRLPIRTDISARPGDIAFVYSYDADLAAQPEGYRLNIADRAAVWSATTTGLFYGMQTLLQGIAQSNDKASLSRGAGLDHPAYKERGVMLDIGRKYFEVSYIKKTIRDLAWYKMNFLHLHFTEWHSFRLQSSVFPGLAAAQAYSKEDIAGIEEYARKYHITIVPEIDLPAHATAITNYNPNLGFACQSMREAKWQGDSTNRKGQAWILDVTRPETKIWVKALLDEFIPLFNGPYFHVGGDEWQYDDQKEACPELMKAVKDSGFQYPSDVFVNFMNDITDHVRSRGKRAQMWSWWNFSPSEMQRNKASIEPDKDVVINIWNAPTMDAVLQSGYKSIITIEEGPGAMYVTPGLGKKSGDYGFFDAKSNYETWNPSVHPGVLGFKLCIWADNAENMPSSWYDGYADLPKAVVAERIWSKQRSKTLEHFENRVNKAKKASELFGVGN